MNPYIIIGVLVGWIASCVGVGWWQNSAGRTAERVEWQAREMKSREAYAAREREIRAEKDQEIGDLQQELANAGAAFEKARRRAEDAESKNDRTAADLRAGRLVLRDPGARGEPAARGEGAAGPAAPGSCDGAPRPEPSQLSRDLSLNLWAEAGRADRVIEDLETRLTYAQDVIVAYYELAKGCSTR